MKLQGGRIASFLKAPDPKVRAILVYGPDGGMVRERIALLTKSVVADPSDPFRVTELTPAQLKEDPARLVDEACALSFTGGRRVVLVRDGGDAHTAQFKSLLATPTAEALVLVSGDDLAKRSSLRLLFEESDTAAALPCYADDAGSLAGVVGEMLKEAGLTAEPDALAFLVDHLGGDRALTRAEMTKLILYMGSDGNRRVSLEDVLACVGDSAALSLDDLAMAVAEGDQAAVQRVLDRLLSEGTNPVAILRTIARHFQRLHLAAGGLAAGKSLDQAMALLKPPVFFKSAERFRRQVQRWGDVRLGLALEMLVQAECDCKTTGLPAAEMCGRALIQIARAAAAGQRGRAQAGR